MKIDRIKEPWGPRTPYGKGEKWPRRVDLYLEEGLSPDDVHKWVQSAAILHSHGDGLDIAVKDGRIVGVRGRPQDRVNHGRLDPKDLFGWQANHHKARLTKPLIRRQGRLVETDWDTAMNAIVDRSRQVLKERGPLAMGFYTSGQLFLEEYYTLGVIGKGGLGTPHMDGNTRLCTATAAAALKESFGSDGQPGSYTDIDHADTIVLYGHNVAETQAVMWMRILDRLAGPEPPKLIVVDPRKTIPAQHADVHLALRPGTNLALLNSLLHQLIENDWIDHEYIAAHTIHFDRLERIVSEYPPERAAEICDVDAGLIRQAAKLIGQADRLVSTVLQGVYQSMSATASACQVNNIHLLRGMLGRPGRGLFQMNGQPTAQNTRESGADGDLPAFRNWDNPAHIQDLARLWNVEPSKIPHWSAPTHAMQIFRHAEEGALQFLWISATNPALSLPDLPRIREILAKESLFLIVQDAFLTETARYADVVLPAAIWGEKTGTFTNVDRTVHLSEKAVEPPGEARSDLDIFLDYARRMDFRDRHDQPLIKWHDPESTFNAWRECTKGQLCDYTGITYQKLRDGTGAIQWPCNDEFPHGKERLYEDGLFPTGIDDCETFGHDLLTGASLTIDQYRVLNPSGRAILKAAHYTPPSEEPDQRYPFRFSTGRTLYHFHSRTKTRHAPQLQAAAPDVWVEISKEDAERLVIKEGDILRVESRRGHLIARARPSHIRPGTLFAPFHYGYFDVEQDPTGPTEVPSAANELTIFDWDPVSKQPYFKFTAARIKKIDSAGPYISAAPTTTASAPIESLINIPPTKGGPHAEATSIFDKE